MTWQHFTKTNVANETISDRNICHTRIENVRKRAGLGNFSVKFQKLLPGQSHFKGKLFLGQDNKKSLPLIQFA